MLTLSKKYVKEQGNYKLVFFLIFFTYVSSIIIMPAKSYAKFIQTFSTRNGGASLTPGDEHKLAKFDRVILNRFVYDDIGGNTWNAIKSINPNTEIYLYQLGRETDDNDDDNPPAYINSLGRWNTSRGHSMGNINSDNSTFFLLDSNSNRIYNTAYKASWVKDVGLKDYQRYWIEATKADIIDQKWAADGIFVDVVEPTRHSMSSLPVKYPSDTVWSMAMNDFVISISAALNSMGQKISGNRTGTSSEIGSQAWIELDNSQSPPNAVFDEGVFAVSWGPNDVQFFPETSWRRQVDILSEIQNSEVWYLSHSDLKEGESGIDNYSKQVNFRDILWYALGSYLLGKNEVDNNSFFSFSESYSIISWYDEFDFIDLGNAMGSYAITNIGGKNIYWREFEKGYVFVNPTESNVSNISLPKPCKLLNHDNFKTNPDNLSSNTTISISSHRAAFLVKESFDKVSSPPSSPELEAPSQKTLKAPKGLSIVNG